MVHQLFRDFKKAYNSVNSLYNSLLESGIPKKLARLIKMCLNETYSEVRVGKLLINFLFRIASNKEMLYQHCFSILL
jgi:hypothetical protein